MGQSRARCVTSSRLQRKRARCLGVAAVTLSLASFPAGGLAKDDAITVVLDPATRQRLAIDVVVLAPATLAASAENTARVLDPAPLAQIDGEIATALSDVSLSRAEAARAEALFDDQIVPAQERDTARARLRADEVHLEDARRRLRLGWGDGIARLADAARRRLIEDLLAGDEALVRVEFAAELAASAPTRVVLAEPKDESTEWPAVVLGVMPQADAERQTAAFLVRVDRAQRRFPTGLVLVARVPTGGPDLHGVVLPRGALLRREGALWAYVERAPNEFERRRVEGGRAVADGWFVDAGFAPGESVVRGGAADLLAAERPVAAAAPAGDADDD